MKLTEQHVRRMIRRELKEMGVDWDEGSGLEVEKVAGKLIDYAIHNADKILLSVLLDVAKDHFSDREVSLRHQETSLYDAADIASDELKIVRK